MVATILAAFVDDPAWAYLTGGDFDRVSPHFARALFDSRVGLGSVWVTDDRLATALWELREARDPDGAGDPEVDRVWTDYREAVGEDVFDLMRAYDDALHEHEPPRPYWYLGVLATHPTAQGRGWARAVLAPVLAIADRDGFDCWLETSKLTNLGFYDHIGFAERIEVDVPDGPTTWWLRRRPASPSAD